MHSILSNRVFYWISRQEPTLLLTEFFLPTERLLLQADNLNYVKRL
jgi:hypothetical protein